MSAKRFCGLILSLILALLCMAYSYSGVRDLQYIAGISVLHDTEKTAADYDAMLKLEPSESPIRFTLYTQYSERQIASVDTSHYESVAIVLLRGDSRLAIPTFATLAPGDITGCLLDRETARILFGDIEAIGSLVRYNGIEYSIRGLLDSPVPLMVLQVPESAEMWLPQIAILGDATEFRLRHGIDGYLVEQAPLLHVAVLLLLLPIETAFLLLLCGLHRLKKLWRKYPLRHLLLFGITLTVVTTLTLLLLLEIPGEYLPSRWSDFRFWSQLGSELKEGFLQYIFAPKYATEMFALSCFMRSLWGIPAAIFIFVSRRVFIKF